MMRAWPIIFTRTRTCSMEWIEATAANISATAIAEHQNRYLPVVMDIVSSTMMTLLQGNCGESAMRAMAGEPASQSSAIYLRFARSHQTSRLLLSMLAISHLLPLTHLSILLSYIH